MAILPRPVPGEDTRLTDFVRDEDADGAPTDGADSDGGGPAVAGRDREHPDADGDGEPAPDTHGDDEPAPDAHGHDEPAPDTHGHDEHAPDSGSAAATATWTPDGEACEACGSVVERRWHDDGTLVCAGCKEW